jgi:hypothetical protein
MKDTQSALRHASIKTTADVYVQQIPESVRAAVNSRTRAILAKRREIASEAGSATCPNREGVVLASGWKEWLLR